MTPLRLHTLSKGPLQVALDRALGHSRVSFSFAGPTGPSAARRPPL